MSTPLYTIEILRLAAAVADFPPLGSPDARETRRSMVCGSTVTVDLAFDDDGRVFACGLSVQACALGQASAAVLAHNVIGKDARAIGVARETLTVFLAGDAPTPGDWPGLAALAPALGYPARHASIRLAFEAAEAAALAGAAA
jgi:NifU-like protein involved in Fe-S cluster formation